MLKFVDENGRQVGVLKDEASEPELFTDKKDVVKLNEDPVPPGEVVNE